MHQPIDDGARTFTGWLGTIAQKPHMCPIRYLSWKAMPKELKKECWHLVERKYTVPSNLIAYAVLKTFTLQKIGKAWRDHKLWLKNKHYIPNSRNEAQIESEKNKERHSRQDDLHSAGSCSFAVHAAKKAKVDGHPVERVALYPIVHTQKNGSAVNPAVQAKMDKMKELFADPSNQLQSSNTSGSIAWSSDDVYAKVRVGCNMEMGMELGYSETVDDHLLFNYAITLIEVILVIGLS
ncbi:uncharacterized protein LOC126719734 [Quercus robur]|uniref:uncharacterized protein LOC126719734 n=1 Tax=Quercus robur TaxID=38942 RepID=UPI002162CA3B|nr:uncharacterized protein LOC126719734 [Quercus robur]